MIAKTEITQFLRAAAGQIYPAATLQVRHQGQIIHDEAVGWLDPESRQQPVTRETLFDLASLTKLFTTTAALRLIAAGKVELDQPVVTILPEFSGQRPVEPYEDPLHPGQLVTVSTAADQVDAGKVTIRHLLTHSSGLPAWRPLYRQAREEIRPFVLHSFFSYPTGTRVVYSDLGLIVLGWAMELLAERPLADIIQSHVLEPLGLAAVHFGPVPSERAAPTEYCQWRQRRIRGEVHDENAWALGGVAAHAGLFGTAAAVAGLGQAWLDVLQGHSDFLLRPLAQEAVQLQAEDGPVRRGLGWALWSPSPESASRPLSRSSFGHTGFTGTSLYVDPERELVITCLTNEVYHGRADRRIGEFRVRLHEEVIEELGN
jgi:CubicO group peptidase (beta-lactamase class C family)